MRVSCQSSVLDAACMTASEIKAPYNQTTAGYRTETFSVFGVRGHLGWRIDYKFSPICWLYILALS